MIVAFFVWAQCATFIGLSAAKFVSGDWRQGAAQVFLAAVTALIYL